MKKGFTIVELLIVIVVIGILAAIVVVAYNGISDQARKTSIKSDLANAAKSLQIYAAIESSYPVNGTQLFGGQEPPLKKLSFSTNPDPYRLLLYCTDGDDFVVAARKTGSPKWWAAAGSQRAVGEVPSMSSGTTLTDCQTLGITTPTFYSWVKGYNGWNPYLQ